MISISLVVVGFILTKYFGHGFWVSVFALSVPIVGYYIYKYQQKQIGFGMLTSVIPLAILATLFVIASALH
jgi:uncharacterized membrane protein